MAKPENNAGQEKAPRESSLHTGFNSLLSASRGDAEDAHGAGLERDREAEGTE